jgi:hypothetical protein
MSAIEIFYRGAPIKERAYRADGRLPPRSPCEERLPNGSLSMILSDENTVARFARYTKRSSITARRASVIISLGMFALTAGCSSILTSGGDGPIVTQKSAPPYASAACFYSDKSGTDRIAGGRVVHWCGPKPRAVF